MRNSCLVVAASFVLLGAVACSGTSVGSATSDGGADGSSDEASTGVDGGAEASLPSSDSSAPGKPKPAAAACEGDQTYDGPPGNCTLESTYQCETATGFDAFRVACSCPSATCGCYTNGTLTKTVAFNGCPACTSPVELAKLCGVAGY